MELWPHQVRAIDGAWQAIEARRRAVIVAPPGAGKSLVMRQITTEALSRGLRVGIFTHRIMLTTQTINGFRDDGIEFGVISSEHKELEDIWAPVQICSMDTFYARLPNRNFHTPRLDVVLIDEAHQQKDKKARSVVFGCTHEDGSLLFEGYHTQGAAILGFTATPVDLGDFYEEMINAGTYSELRQCGAHIPVVGYCAEVPNEKGLRTQSSGEYSSKKVAARMRVESIFGNVYEWWAKLNPDARPAILFAPGVNESRGFVVEFARKGVCCAHISGETVMMARKNANGVVTYDEWPTSESLRAEVLEGSQDGTFKVLCNRFVLREAVDCLDEKTEVLTPSGWKGIDDPILVGGNVYSFNLNTHAIEVVPVDCVSRRMTHFDEKMVSIKGLHTDIRVTEGHRFHVKYKDPHLGRLPKTWVTRKAEEIATRKADYYLPLCGEMKFPGVDLTNDELAFLGWWVTDGGFEAKSAGCRVMIYQKKLNYVIEIIRLLKRLGITYRENLNESSGCYTFAIRRKEIPRILPFLNKEGCYLWDNMTRKQFRHFWNHLCKGDGTFRMNGRWSPVLTIGKKTLADKLCAMAVVRGYSCNVGQHNSSYSGNPYWIATIRTQRYRSSRPSDERAARHKLETLRKPERVWCVTNRNDTLITRRNGRVCILGNCPWLYHGIFATMIGGLSTYLQTVGRIQRAYPGMHEAIMQDHGGNYDRHLSPNIPRHWSLGCSNAAIAKEVYKKKQETATEDDPEPIACNRCGAYRMYGKTCPQCGHFQKQQIRFVRQLAGELVRRKGRLVKFKKNKPPSADDFFRGVLYRYARAGKTVGQATGCAYAQGKSKGFNLYRDCRTIPVYSKTDPEWLCQVKSVYTWIRV